MIVVDRTLKMPLYEQIYNRIKEDIVSGRMPEGQALVPIRAFAVTLGVSKNTIDLAYKQLLAEGYIKAKRGSGYFVENMKKYGIDMRGDIDSDIVKEDAHEKSTDSEKSRLLYDFSFESVNSTEFEWKKWKKCIDESLYEEEYNFSGYKDCRGDIGLRRSIAKYIFNTRNVRCSASRVVICSGTLYAINMSVNVINRFRQIQASHTGAAKDTHSPKMAGCDPECENHIKNVFISKGYDICDLSEDCTGDILYVSPSHQYPSGYTMDSETRRKYIDYAEKNDSYIIENDCDSEFAYGKQRIPSMQSMCSDRVIYVSSVSRILSPNIRLAYMVLPERFIDIFMELYDGYRTAVPVLHQRTLARYIDMGYMQRHIRKLLHTNEEKLDIILQCLKKLEAEQYISIAGQPAGGYIAIKPVKNRDLGLVEYAKRKGIGLYEEGQYILIGYLSIEREAIDDAAKRLYEVIKEYGSLAKISH